MMPMGMAGGGLVAFEQGGPIRAQAGLFADPTQFISEPGTPLQFKVRDYFTGGVYNEMAELQKAGFTDAQISQMSPEQRTQVVQSTRQESQGAPSGADLEKRFAPAMAAPTTAIPPQPGAAPGAAPAAGGLGAFKPGALPSAQPVVDAIQALRDQTKMPTEQALDEAGQARAKRYEEDLPFREKEILERRITNRAEQIAKDKDMSFNDALIAAGAAILKSPGTPGSLAWMGEGLSAFGTTMKEGRKDIRKSEELMELSELELAKAESARDAGKFNQYEAGRDKAFDLANKSREFAATNAALAVNQYTAQLGAAKLPYELAEMQSKAALQSATANLYRKGGAGALTAAAKAGMAQPTAMDIQMAQLAATEEYERAKIKASPQQIDERAQLMLQRQFPGYTPLPPVQPAVRSLPGGQGATLAPGT
jgi:hypothetical protein